MSRQPTEGWESERTPSSPRSLLSRLLRVPLFLKVLLANAVVVAVAVVATALFTAGQFPEVDHGAISLPVAGLGLLALALSAGLNAVILRAALAPVLELEKAARRVEQGELEARARTSPVADAELSRLTGVFNSMLDSLKVQRRRLRQMTARALDAQERERAAIARALQDDAAQRLALLLIRLRVAARRAAQNGSELDLEEIREELSEVLDRVNRIARDLRPPELDDLGVVTAIQKLIRRLQEESGLEVEYRADDVGTRVSGHRALVLYRIVQEALENAVRHADARTVTVALERRGGTVTALVEDDGQGFSLGEELAGSAENLGLNSMSERAAFVGGEVSIQSESGIGTKVRVEIPVDRQQEARSST